MTIEKSAPEEVLVVHAALVKNAEEAQQPDDAVYTHQSPTDPESWIICDNYERWGFAMVYKNGQWFYRSFFGEGDKLMPGGLEEATANAKCAYTG